MKKISKNKQGRLKNRLLPFIKEDPGKAAKLRLSLLPALILSFPLLLTGCGSALQILDGDGMVNRIPVTEEMETEGEITTETESTVETESTPGTEITVETEISESIEESSSTEDTFSTEADAGNDTEAGISAIPGTETEMAEVNAALPPSDSSFVCVRDYIPDIVVDLKYATEDNFTGEVIYDFEEAYLRYGTVVKLAKVQEALREQGLGIKIWDAFRPVASQFKLWEIVPNSTYVANPYKGYSSHSRGNTVDIALIRLEDGSEITMPTGFDDFSSKADRDYSDVSKEAAANARLLENLMSDNGFKPYQGEWWHFSDTIRYEADEEFMP